MTFDNWAGHQRLDNAIMDDIKWTYILRSTKVEDEIRSLFTTSNINLFAANIYVEAPMNSQRACGGQGNGSSRGLIQSIVHSLCDVYRLATFKHRAGTGICRL